MPFINVRHGGADMIKMLNQRRRKNLRAESKSETGLETFAVAEEGVVLGWIGGLPGSGGGLKIIRIIYSG